jgi:uncharacterized protein YPO0396
MDTETRRALVLPEGSSQDTYVLTHLDVYNWGAFSGRHTAEFDFAGTAVIGPTASGKTTLIDALMTLLVETPRYNIASSGGESDRDLVSYVRGVSGAGNNSGDNQHIARSGVTQTGIAARFSNGHNVLQIGAVFWIDDTSSAAADLKRQWIFCEAPAQNLDAWLEALHSGGARQLRQIGRETANLHIDPSKQTYLAHLRRFFAVGENAFTLLNRAAGLKQLTSIDDIFRELVLEDTSTFERATEVAKEFDDLTAIHNELEIARQQQRALQPIAETGSKRGNLIEQLDRQRALRAALPIWYATHGYHLWGQEVGRIDEQLTAKEYESRQVALRITSLDQEAQALRDMYLRAGGASIEDLRGQIETQRELVAQRRRNADDYRRLTKRLDLNDDLAITAILANQARARELQASKGDALAKERQEAWQLGATQQRHHEELNKLTTDLEQARARPGSNIPGPYQEFRADLAAELDVAEHQLPFVGELIEVKPDEGGWRGAIERAVGGDRLRIMVPTDCIKHALHWVNHRNNRLHVRLFEVKGETATPQFFADGYTRKLKYKQHPHREALKHFLATVDRHCVASSDELHSTAHGLTIEGGMSDRSGRFQKQDQRRLDQDWFTGFDNKDLLSSLTSQLKDVRRAFDETRAKHEAAQQRAEVAQGLLQLVKQLTELDPAAIDLPAAETTLAALESRLSALSDPSSDTEKARLDWQQAATALKQLREQQDEFTGSIAVLARQKSDAEDNRQRYFRRIGEGLTDAQRTIADQGLEAPRAEALRELEDLERKAAEKVDTGIGSSVTDLHDCERKLTAQMGNAKKVDTGALAEAGTDMQDIPTYLERLRQLTEEALPEKQQRFLTYLNHSSDQGVTQLLSDVENEVTTIEERIEDLNRTLRRVDFQPGRYLRLEPQRIVHESLRTLQNAQRHLRSAALKDDQGESHFAALKRVVDLLRDAADRKKTLGARALLDPRYRLQFSVHVIERETGAIIEIRKSSEGGSGGEKEVIASYVLTASLSYALCPDGRERPLFGTIVLDEAFSRSSRAVAGRIISALREFGLHPLFVTPNKEIPLLRAHTRSAILVHRKGQRATLTSISWEELDAQSGHRNATRPATT